MHRKLLRKLQTAQGMVEFALVLPLLLLVILGIFAFGHLFFVYSSVVSASREAARWGAAVGEAPSTSPRYQDCDAIRASAVRIGSFAGVDSTDILAANDSGVEVSYDPGPDESGASVPFASCPAGGTGPSDVVMGDRIIVRVKVNYVPIIPFINIPSFPLEATTFRTILRSVPVGDAPTAVDPCTSTTHIEMLANPEPSVVGQAVSYNVKVVVDDPISTDPPTGVISLYDDTIGTPYFCSHNLVAANAGSWTCTPPVTYWVAGPRVVNVRFDSDNVCFLSSTTSEPGPDPVHQVNQATTDLVLGVSPSVVVEGNELRVNVTVQSLAPGAGVPQGWVMVTFPGQAPLRVDLANGTGSATIIPTSAGSFPIKVEYPEDADPNYMTVTEEINVTVLQPSPTFISTPTKTVPPSVPTKTPLPDYCPRLASDSYDFFQVGSAIQLPIYNPNVPGSTKTNVSSVEINWPGDPVARLQEIRWGSTVDSCDGGGNGNCLWQNATGLDPVHQNVSSSTAGWNSSFDDFNKGATNQMRMVFNHSMPQGSYLILVRFSDNNCVLEIERDKVTP